MDIAFIITCIQLCIKAAPDVAKFAKDAKAFVDAMFARGEISLDQQQKVKAYVDACQIAALANVAPPAWTVESDPE